MAVSKVYLREEAKSVRVLNGEGKPEIPGLLRDKWQRLIDLLSKIFDTPASLIMRLKGERIEVFLASKSEGNPYRISASESLGDGLYCETVIGRRRHLEIANALNDEVWRDNPDVRFGMVSYCGYPLAWPDGAVFGTICTLDDGRGCFEESLNQLMETFKEIIELDLRQILEIEELKATNEEMNRSLRETNHRLKNNLNNVLSYMQLKRTVDDSAIDSVFGEVESRIRAISLIHEQLTGSHATSPETVGYLTELIDLTVKAISPGPVQTDLQIDPVPLGTALLDVGSVVVELISNSAKHAFADAQNHRLSVRLTEVEGYCELTYTDYGPGVAEGTRPGLGTYVFESTVQKYHGSYSVGGEDRNVFVFRFGLPTA